MHKEELEENLRTLAKVIIEPNLGGSVITLARNNLVRERILQVVKTVG